MTEPLNRDNYFSDENNMLYMGSSQFKSFNTCESSALAQLKGEWPGPSGTALLVGSYIDAYFEGSLDKFKSEHPEIFSKSGSLKADYIQAEMIIERVSRDPMFMRFMAGEKQTIMTGEIEGVPVKIRIDSYHPEKTIVDLKCMKDFAPIWSDEDGYKVPFVEKWGYDYQGAMYQEIERQQTNRKKPLPFFLAAVTKQNEPDLAIISIHQEMLDCALLVIKARIKRFDDIKHGLIEPERCGRCEYCRHTKVLTEIVDYREVGNG